MSPERRAVIARLKFFDKQFQELLALVEKADERRLSPGERSEANDRLKKLKSDLEAEIKDLHKRRGELNKYESAFLVPAVKEASADIQTRVGTTPDSKWYSV